MKILEIYQYFLMVGLGFTGLNLLILAINLLALRANQANRGTPKGIWMPARNPENLRSFLKPDLGEPWTAPEGYSPAPHKPPFIPICPVCNGLKCSHANGVCVSSEHKKGNCVGCTERCLTCLGTGRAIQGPQEGPQPQPPADARHMGKDGASRGISEAVQRVKDDQDCVECFGTQCVDAVCLMSVRDCQKCANRCQACQGTGKAASDQ